jgi:hypothetical protein
MRVRNLIIASKCLCVPSSNTSVKCVSQQYCMYHSAVLKEWCKDPCRAREVREWCTDPCRAREVRGWCTDPCRAREVRGWCTDPCRAREVRGWSRDALRACEVSPRPFQRICKGTLSSYAY